MQRRRFIPKGIFQLIALLLLALCLFLIVFWIMTGSGLYEIFWSYNWIKSKLMAMALTFLGTFMGWVAVVLPLRIFSQMPTIQEELGADLGDGLPAVAKSIQRLYAEQKAKNEEIYTATEYTPEMTQHARQIGFSFLVAGVVLTMAGIWMAFLIVEMGRVYAIQILVMILGPVLTVIGLIQLITGRSVIRK